jgi:tRNA nucleotidyltransferase/poly(A) polymerase
MKTTATGIVERLRAAGFVAYFAGGCVRDMLRNVEPHDYDIATSATPEQVQKIFPHTIPVGARFGVVLVLENGHQFEVATFRSDDAYIDGRRPSSVRYGSPEEDAQRRDFTINGLFYDPVQQEVLDYVNGRADIERRVVRTIGEPRHRFTEDKLRLLRCVRFAGNLDYTIEPATFAAVKEMAPQIQVVSAERIRDELVKIFTRPNAGRGFELLDQSGLLQQILPEISAMKGCEQPPEFHPEGDVFQHTKLMLDILPPNPGIVLAFSVLLHDVGKPPTFTVTDRIRFNDHDRVGATMTETILRRLRFSNDEIARVVTCVGEHMRIRNVQEMRPAKLKRILARDTFSEELELHRLDCTTSHGDIGNYEFLRQKAAELPAEVIRPAPLVTGNDLLALGLKPGPLIGQILREVAELQLEERLKSREEAVAFVKQRLAVGST